MHNSYVSMYTDSSINIEIRNCRTLKMYNNMLISNCNTVNLYAGAYLCKYRLNFIFVTYLQLI